MRQTKEEVVALVMGRVRKAHEAWEETKVIIAEELWYAAANRMYYSCFYMTSALLACYDLSAKTHAGVIRLLGMNFVMKGIISQELNKFYVELFELRQKGDYDDYVSIGSADVMPLVNMAEEYLATIETLINNKIETLQ